MCAVVILDRNVMFRCGAGCIFKGWCARACGAVASLDGNAVSCCGRRATSKAGATSSAACKWNTFML